MKRVFCLIVINYALIACAVAPAPPVATSYSKTVLVVLRDERAPAKPTFLQCLTGIASPVVSLLEFFIKP